MHIITKEYNIVQRVQQCPIKMLYGLSDIYVGTKISAAKLP